MTFDQSINLATELAEKNDVEAAIATLMPLLAQVPGHPVPQQMLGILHARQGRRDVAAQFLVQAVNAHCCWDTASPLLMVLWESARWADIAQFGEAARDVFADNALFLNVWGAALTNLGRPAEALIILDRALALTPAESAIHRNRSTALVLLGWGEESVEAFSRSATPWTGDLPAKEASATRQAYAALSAGYDGNVLHQSFTRLLSEHLTRALPNHAPLQVLELGCGTGLLAARLPPGVERLVGVDLSPEMLAQARARGGYHELIEGDLLAMMARQPGPFDTIASACVLYHLADLQPLFTQVARLLCPAGVFVFSTDPMADSTDIGVSSPGEFCHSRPYLRRLAALAGLEEIAIEIDSHRGPPGFWCVFRKPPQTAPAKVHHHRDAR